MFPSSPDSTTVSETTSTTTTTTEQTYIETTTKRAPSSRLRINSRANSTLDVRVTLIDDDNGTTVLNETVEFDPDEQHQFDSYFTPGHTYRLTLRIQNTTVLEALIADHAGIEITIYSASEAEITHTVEF